MNRAIIKKQSKEEISEEICDRKPPLDKGIEHWDAFITPNPEDKFLNIITGLHVEGGIEAVMRHLRPSRLHYIEQVLGAWVSEAEKLLGLDDTKTGEKFINLANRWHQQTDYLSSPSHITDNDTYLEIISMGESVIPFILKDMQVRGGDWYRALRILSGTDQVPVEDRGDVPRMKEAWFNWGRDKGYIK